LPGKKKFAVAILTGLLAAAAWLVPAARAEKREIDVAHSVMKVHVYKTGLFSGFAHDHEISAPIARGTVDDSANPIVELAVESGKLQVEDPGVSDKDRAQIQQTMQGPQVLDSVQYPEIRFRSTRVQPAGNGRWTIDGDLSLHGQTHPVQVTVTKKEGKYEGSAAFKQRAFGITPVSIAGGAVKVKDEVKIEFQIVLAQ
jgi:polyisoprenoid-binding protein YceI